MRRWDGPCKKISDNSEGTNLIKKTELVREVASISGLTQRDSSKAIKALIKMVQTTLKNGGVISLSGLGSFRVKSCKARQGRNPKTGEIIPVPPGKKISFKPTENLKEKL
ncbi:MAG: HU family DNA-binding protein [Endomicrobium sp.]|jgi:nucleoid DNA-binding protein|nr:HU family DNA-binding protein [Endomicrobium sp.]